MIDTPEGIIMKNGQAGFTIIEMAIVMVIIGMLVGFGASLIGPLSIRAKRIESTEIVEAGAEAILGQASASRGVLPSVSEFPGIIKKRNDAWTNPIHYVHDATLSDNDPTTGDLCTRKTTHITVNQCQDAACSSAVTVTDVAFLVLSGGENFNNQTSGSLGVTGATVINVYPAGVDPVDGYSGDIDRPEGYDDIVHWATLNEIRSQIRCRGPQLAILNNELPPGRLAITYSAAIYVEGGVPFSSGGDYLWCIETASGAPPPGLNFRDHSDSSDVGFDTDGSLLAESSSTWTDADSLQISGTPTTAGSYLLTVWVRDNNNSPFDPACSASGNRDNCDHRSFVLTVSP